MHLISAVIITYNEENNIGRCIESLQLVADEIIVLDSWSSDRTVEIAKKKGAIVKEDYFRGYIQQKNAGIVHATHDYILSLDADEALDNELTQSILALKTGFSADAYAMNRCTNYCGQYIRNGSWYPDKKIRLFNKHTARWGGSDPHESIEVNGTCKNIGHLKGDILHYSFPTIEAQLEKSNRYSSMLARSMYAKGRSSNWFKILVNPCWTFFQGFIIRMGFLDGFYGFVIAVNSAHATFLKYIKLYQLQRQQPSASAAHHNLKATLGGKADNVVNNI